jgi:hypothetical protein
MDLALLIYGISFASSLNGLMVFIGIITGIAIIGMTMYRVIECVPESWDGEKASQLKLAKAAAIDRKLWFTGIVFSIAVFLHVAIPNEKTMYMMVGAYATQKVAENDKVQETGKKVLTIIEQKLDTYVEEGVKEATKRAESAIKGDKK